MSPDIQNQREKLNNALCLTLSERIDQVEWDSLSENDWSRFANMAIAEGVAPLIHWTFKHEDISGIDIPTTVKAQLMAAYYNTTAQNQVIFKELERILGALDEADIPVIVLKGAALAATVYPEIGLRPMGDIDLLIQKKHLINALSRIRSLGYFEEPVLSYRLKRRIGFNFHLWQKNEPKVKVELHWGLVGGQDTWYHPAIEWFWDQTETSNTKPTSLALTPTAHTLYLTAHIWIQHGLSQAKLLWFYDLHLIISKYHKSIEWKEILNQAQDFQWTVALYETLTKVKERFSTPIPDELIKEIGTLCNREKGTFFTRKAKTRYSRMDRYLSRLSSMSYSSGLVWFFTKIFPNPKFIKWHYKPYPEWIWPLYYPYRWFEKVFKS